MKRLCVCGSSAIGQLLLVGAVGIGGLTAVGSLGDGLAQNVSGSAEPTVVPVGAPLPQLSGRSEAASGASAFARVARALEKVDLPSPSAQRYGAVALRVDAPAELAEDVWASALSHIGSTDDVAANRANAIAALGDEGEWRGLLVSVMEDLHARQVSLRVDPRDRRPGGHSHGVPGYDAIRQAMPHNLRTVKPEQQFYGLSRPDRLRQLAQAAKDYVENPPPKTRGGRQWFGQRMQYGDLSFDEALVERLVAIGEAFGDGLSDAKRNRLFGDPAQDLSSAIYGELDVPSALRTADGQPVAGVWRDAYRAWDEASKHVAHGAYEDAYASLQAVPGHELLLGYMLEIRARLGKSTFDSEVLRPKTRGQLSPEGQVLNMAAPGGLAYYANKIADGSLGIADVRYIDEAGYIDEAMEARLKAGMQLAAGETIELTRFGP